MLFHSSFVALFFTFLWAYTSSLKVLILAPSQFHSHLGFNIALAKALAKAGHYVHFVILDSLPTPLQKRIEIPGNVTLTYYRPTEQTQMAFAKTMADYHFSDPANIFERNFYWTDEPAHQKANLFLLPFKDFVNDVPMFKKLKAKKFDAGLAECFDPLAFATFHRLGISTTFVTTSFGVVPSHTNFLGVPHPIGHPETLTAPLQGVGMSIWQRANNLYQIWRSTRFFNLAYEHVDEFTRNNFGSNFPTSLELLQRTSYLFVNMNELLDIARPTSPKMKFIGGIAAAQQPSVSANSKQLDCDVQQIFDKAKRGVVIVSFGSIIDVRVMPKQMRSAMFAAFFAFPDFEFIWRLPNASAIDGHDALKHFSNIHPMDWVPQVSILCTFC